MFNPAISKSDRRVKLLITKFKRNKITPSHNHATLLLHNKGIFNKQHACFETNFDLFKSCLSIYSGTSVQRTPSVGWGFVNN